MLEKVKNALRVKSAAFDDEVSDLIAAALEDLKQIGILSPQTDPLVIRAVIIYTKLHFGFMDAGARKQYEELYDKLKCQLSLSKVHTTATRRRRQA
jgi:hypothetical protein